MTYLLGVDTGGTYTDAVVMDEATDVIVASAKALTTRPDLSFGVGAAIDAVLTDINPADVALVSLSTTLATNALVEGQGGRVALVLIGFDPAELERAGLKEALRGDPVYFLPGGHGHSGAEMAPFAAEVLAQHLVDMPDGLTGFVVAGSFATRNAAHEIAACDMIRTVTGMPVTCSHELSSALGGPKRALTAVLNARLIGMLDGLITAVEHHMTSRGIFARLMVVRGDGALVSAAVAREKPIETILSGPAASIAGAQWLTGEQNALVSDIGGTTTDVCLLRDGRPQIDPKGARVGPYRTMVEAVAMRTTGLGGDSEVHVVEGLHAGLRLGPRRLMPMALAAHHYPDIVHMALDKSLSVDTPAVDGGQIVIPLWSEFPQGLDAREAIVAGRLREGPIRYGIAVTTRMESPALGRLVTRGLVMLAGVTPSDASHVLGCADVWDTEASQKALTLFARKRSGSGDRLAPDATALAQMIVDQLTAQTVDCLLDAAFAEDDRDWDADPNALTKHPLTKAGLDQHRGVIETTLKLGVPIIGLGASASTYYGAVGVRLNTRMILPGLAGVANAIGAVVGQVSVHETGSVTSGGLGNFVTLGETFAAKDAALAALETHLSKTAKMKAKEAGVEEIRMTTHRDINEVTIEGQAMFIEATIKVTAQGRPRIADG
jgi:N-methylhydantoinase A/oxoprolinase/acetone carboxylase beta subunit